MSSPVSESTTDLLRSSIICAEDDSCLVVGACCNEECESIDVDKVITEVYKELPPGKYHESERLWEILYRLHVVDDNEVPEFITALSTPSEKTTPEPQAAAAPENNISGFLKGFQSVLSELDNFTETKEGKTMMSSLPGNFGDNIIGAVKELNDKSDENPLAKILGMFTSGN